jgi:hypothetical protein
MRTGSLRRGGLGALLLVLSACVAPAGSIDSAAGRDPLWDGAVDGPEPDATADAAEDAAALPPDAFVAAQPPRPPPRIDGRFDDWAPQDRVADDPSGDADGAFDVTGVSARSRGTVLYLRVDLAAALNLHFGDESDGTLRVRLGLPGRRTLEADTRARNLEVDGRWLRWPEIAYLTAPTHASRVFEIRFDLASLDVAVGDTVLLQLAGSDSLSEAVPLVLNAPPAELRRRSPARTPGTAFRVATLNTHESGLENPVEAPKLHRLITAVTADIYCFQEEYNISGEDVGRLLNTLDPRSRWWHAERDRNLVVASTKPLVLVPDESNRFLAVVVDRSPERSVMVVSYHGTCCGYAGTEEDASRVRQTEALARLIGGLRDGALGETLRPFRDVPVVVVGDFNLVGTRAPVDALTRPAGLGMTWWIPSHLVGDDAWTWRQPEARLSPGILDLVLYDPRRLERRNGFVLDTAELGPDVLEALTLQAGDSAASDHLMVVVDFALK